MMQGLNSPRAQLGYFLLADISGFSPYLAGVELEHAGGILQRLLEGISQNLRPTLVVREFDMDAVFASAPQPPIIQFNELYKLVERTYFEFKSDLIEISNHRTCHCAACRNVTSLDLKFIVHHGNYILSQVRDKTLLYGLDPTFVRNRSWKDIVSASVSWRGYVLFTKQYMTNAAIAISPFQGAEFSQDGISMFGLELKSNDPQHES